MTKLGTVVRTTERLGGVDGSGEVCMVEPGELARVEAEDDKPDTFILVPCNADGDYDGTAEWAEAYNVIARQWEEVTP